MTYKELEYYIMETVRKNFFNDPQKIDFTLFDPIRIDYVTQKCATVANENGFSGGQFYLIWKLSIDKLIKELDDGKSMCKQEK